MSQVIVDLLLLHPVCFSIISRYYHFYIDWFTYSLLRLYLAQPVNYLNGDIVRNFVQLCYWKSLIFAMKFVFGVCQSVADWGKICQCFIALWYRYWHLLAVSKFLSLMCYFTAPANRPRPASELPENLKKSVARLSTAKSPATELSERGSRHKSSANSGTYFLILNSVCPLLMLLCIYGVYAYLSLLYMI